MRKSFVASVGRSAIIAVAMVAFAFANRASAVGWDSNDFIITGAPNFPDRIGIFDHDFTFKGYLDQNFFGVSGMDFDAQGRLVAQSFLNPEVRVYDPSGTTVGGFTQASSPMLVPGSDVEVAPDGNYVLGTLSSGVRVFTPQGTFVRQFGDGNSTGVTLVPDNLLWAGGAGNTVRIFDFATGVQVGSLSAGSQVNAGLLQYSATTGSVLMVDTDRDAGGVFEREINGALLHEFHVPVAQVSVRGATRGPEGNVFGTTSRFSIDIVDWRFDGTVLRTIDVYPVEITTVSILWAGIVPEPTGGLVAAGISLFLLRRIRSQIVSGRRGK